MSGLDDDQVLDFTQSVRQSMVCKMITNEATGLEEFPDDLKERVLILQTLKDMDAQALGKKRIVVADKMNDSVAIAAEAIRLSFTQATSNPFQSEPIEHVPAAPQLDIDVEMVPNEMGIGVSTLTFTEFAES